jgi:hypothetical protein
MPLQEHVIRFFFPLPWFITAWIIGKREKSKRSAQDYNRIKRRLGKQDGYWKCLNLLDGKYLPTVYRLV